MNITQTIALVISVIALIIAINNAFERSDYSESSIMVVNKIRNLQPNDCDYAVVVVQLQEGVRDTLCVTQQYYDSVLLGDKVTVTE